MHSCDILYVPKINIYRYTVHDTTEEKTMKIKKAAALILAAFITAAVSAGCMDNSKNNTTDSLEDIIPTKNTTPVDPIGSHEIKGVIGSEITENDTSFTLKSVIVPDSDDSEKFVYFDIDLRNNTDTAYTLSTLNNFYIQLADGTDVYSDVRSQLYAGEIFKKDKYFLDPFDIPSNGQFSGIVGGFVLRKDVNDFTVCFFPTGSNPNDKGTVIKFAVTAENISAPDPSVIK